MFETEPERPGRQCPPCWGQVSHGCSDYRLGASLSEVVVAEVDFFDFGAESKKLAEVVSDSVPELVVEQFQDPQVRRGLPKLEQRVGSAGGDEVSGDVDLQIAPTILLLDDARESIVGKTLSGQGKLPHPERTAHVPLAFRSHCRDGAHHRRADLWALLLCGPGLRGCLVIFVLLCSSNGISSRLEEILTRL